MLTAQGRFDEAEEEFKRSQQVDPFSTLMSILLQWRFWLEHRYDQVLEQCRKAIELEPNVSMFHLNMALAYEQQGKLSEAMAALQKAKALEDTTMIQSLIGRIYAVSGKKGEARKVLDELRGQSKQRWVSPYLLALIHLELGEKDEAFALFDKAYESRDEWLVGLKNDPRVDSVRSDPRFQNLMARMGFQ